MKFSWKPGLNCRDNVKTQWIPGVKSHGTTYPRVVSRDECGRASSSSTIVHTWEHVRSVLPWEGKRIDRGEREGEKKGGERREKKNEREGTCTRRRDWPAFALIQDSPQAPLFPVTRGIAFSGTACWAVATEGCCKSSVVSSSSSLYRSSRNRRHHLQARRPGCHPCHPMARGLRTCTTLISTFRILVTDCVRTKEKLNRKLEDDRFEDVSKTFGKKDLGAKERRKGRR